MKSKQTHKISGKKCAKTECLTVNIYKHISKQFTYIVWNKENLIGEVVEDDIMKLLDKEQVIDFYHREKNKFKISLDNINNFVEKPKSND